MFLFNNITFYIIFLGVNEWIREETGIGFEASQLKIADWPSFQGNMLYNSFQIDQTSYWSAEVKNMFCISY